MEDSEPAEDGLLAGLRWNRSAREQVQLKHKIRDLPGLLKHGLHLRKKSVSISLTVRLPGPERHVRPAAFPTELRGSSSHDLGVFLCRLQGVLSQCARVCMHVRARARELHP